MKKISQKTPVLLAAFLMAIVTLPAGAQTPVQSPSDALSPAQKAMDRAFADPAFHAASANQQSLSSTPEGRAALDALGASPAATSATGSATTPATTPSTAPGPVAVPKVTPPAPPAPVVLGMSPLLTRRTLHVEVGQHKLVLEAPRDMCFIDRTSPVQEQIFQLLAGPAELHRDQVMMAVFMDCDNIRSPDSWADGIPDYGYFTWLNPSVGETTPMKRQDYLDMREASFPQYVKGHLLGKQDGKVFRNKNAVFLGVKGEDLVQSSWHQKNLQVLSTTVIRHIPLEVTMHYAGDHTPDFDEAYDDTDMLITQEIKLND